MPRKPTLNPPAIDLGSESMGQRLSRLRKKRGLTQVIIAEKMGIIQSLITDYERDKLRPHPEMIARFALALGVSTDEIIGLKNSGSNDKKMSLRIVRRMQELESLPADQLKTVLKSIDLLIKAAKA